MRSVEIQADEGYFFGLSVFETIGMEQGKPVFLKEHLERMKASAKVLGIPGQVTESQVEDWIRSGEGKLYRETFRHGALKIVLSEKNLLFLPRENHYKAAQYQTGFVMDYSRVLRNETSLLVRHKTGNYGDCILEKRAAAACGMDERIFRNTRGELTEGTVSNLFFVKDGKLFTPALSCGLLPGILRRYLLEKEDAQERVIVPEEAGEFQECFVTNSLMGVMPVKRLGDCVFPSREKADQVRERYLKELLS